MKFSFLRALTTLITSLTILSMICLGADAQQFQTPKWFGTAHSRSGDDVQSLYNSNAQRPLGGLFAPGFTRTLTVLGGVNFPSGGTQEDFESQIDITPEDPADLPIGVDGALDDTGYALSFAFGRRHSNTLRSEIEIAIRGNDLTDIVTTGAASVEEDDGRVNATSLMKNFIIDFTNDSRFTPYAGVGIGLSFVDVEQGQAPSFGFEQEDDRTLFSYQAIGGVATQLSSSTDFIVEYRFLGTSEGEFEVLGQELSYNTSSLFLGLKFEY